MTRGSERPLLALIGTLSPAGGTTLLLRQLIAELRDVDRFRLAVVDSSRHGGSSITARLRDALRSVGILGRSAVAAMRADIVALHASPPATARAAPLLWLICKIRRVPFVVREFGGFLDGELDRMSGPSRWGMHRALMADAFLVETRQMVQFVESEFPGARCHWYSNSRPVQPNQPDSKVPAPSPVSHGGARRFVFVGSVSGDKGVRELIAAAAALHDLDIQIDVWGELTPDINASDFDASSRISYCGPLAPEAVIATLRRYDALVLPTYYEGEGYPGVVLEAYSVALPVVATRWRAIPEIVEHEGTGLLVPPRDVPALVAALRRLHDDDLLCSTLSRAAGECARKFDSGHWTQVFSALCLELLELRNGG